MSASEEVSDGGSSILDGRLLNHFSLQDNVDGTRDELSAGNGTGLIRMGADGRPRYYVDFFFVWLSEHIEQMLEWIKGIARH
jgi:hypothetical protein